MDLSSVRSSTKRKIYTNSIAFLLNSISGSDHESVMEDRSSKSTSVSTSPPLANQSPSISATTNKSSCNSTSSTHTEIVYGPIARSLITSDDNKNVTDIIQKCPYDSTVHQAYQFIDTTANKNHFSSDEAIQNLFTSAETNQNFGSSAETNQKLCSSAETNQKLCNYSFPLLNLSLTNQNKKQSPNKYFPFVPRSVKTNQNSEKSFPAEEIPTVRSKSFSFDRHDLSGSENYPLENQSNQMISRYDKNLSNKPHMRYDKNENRNSSHKKDLIIVGSRLHNPKECEERAFSESKFAWNDVQPSSESDQTTAKRRQILGESDQTTAKRRQILGESDQTTAKRRQILGESDQTTAKRRQILGESTISEPFESRLPNDSASEYHAEYSTTSHKYNIPELLQNKEDIKIPHAEVTPQDPHTERRHKTSRITAVNWTAILDGERDLELLKTTRHVYSNACSNNYLKGCQWSADGLALATSSKDKTLRVYNFPDFNSSAEQVSKMPTSYRFNSIFRPSYRFNSIFRPSYRFNSIFRPSKTYFDSDKTV